MIRPSNKLPSQLSLDIAKALKEHFNITSDVPYSYNCEVAAVVEAVMENNPEMVVPAQVCGSYKLSEL